MSIFKTEVDTKLALTSDSVVRSDMEFDGADKARLPGLKHTTEMSVVNTMPGAVRRKNGEK
jgi:hypothetical protein